KEAGVNLYVGLWKGPTAEQLDGLRAAAMPVICEQNDFALSRLDDPIIVGWMHGDEPDNAQEVRDPKTGRQNYGPPVAPAKIVADYERLRAADPTRPIMLNLGQGVANDQWKGRGSGASLDDYPAYVRGADIVSFDVYPVAGLERPDGADFLWYVPKGVDRLVRWTEGKKPVWNCIECTHVGDPKAKATPAQVRAEVWMSLIHGSRGLIYFVHEFAPRFNEHALLDDPEMLAAVTSINREIHDLAPVLNSPSLLDEAGILNRPGLFHDATAGSSASDVPVDMMAKRHDGDLCIFAVNMRNEPTQATFTVSGVMRTASIEVLNESRTLSLQANRFSDDFAPYAVHLYRLDLLRD
ncbi:MAG: hypothetical protein NTW86_19740, partial [Candidatus Sumerlaeota bacterium]|nr:hypothetical protein [Candidatus Sumerlaeota bacterium]